MKNTNRIGRTPLLRARNLEKKLGIEKIFLKLEGNNLGGNRLDRLSILLIKDAIASKKDTICLAENVFLAKSLAVLSQFYNLKCVFVFKDLAVVEGIDEFKRENVQILKSEEDAISRSMAMAKENLWYDANPSYQNAMLNILALSGIADELAKKIRKPISNVYIQTGVGYGISGMHLGFKRLWIEGKVDKVPVLHGCTSETGNVIYEEYKKTNLEAFHENTPPSEMSKYNINVYNTGLSTLKSVFDAVHDTGGKVKGISDDLLEKHMDFFREVEPDIEISIENAYSIAGFLRDVEDGKIQNGIHVVVLNDGKVSMDIEEVEAEEVDVDMVVDCLHNWLEDYRDSKEEIKEAVLDARKTGHILFARQNDEVIAIALVVNLKFNHFIPQYHLGYIAAKNGQEGKGIATELLNKVIDLTDGKFSLHVESGNERAIAVYEKMGLKKSYVRMIYKEED
jgi:threonine synthase